MSVRRQLHQSVLVPDVEPLQVGEVALALSGAAAVPSAIAAFPPLESGPSQRCIPPHQALDQVGLEVDSTGRGA